MVVRPPAESFGGLVLQSLAHRKFVPYLKQDYKSGSFPHISILFSLIPSLRETSRHDRNIVYRAVNLSSHNSKEDQCRPWSDAAFCCVCFGYALFVLWVSRVNSGFRTIHSLLHTTHTKVLVIYCWLSLSRPHLSRITAHLEVIIWSLLKPENLTTGNKILSLGAISPLFHNIFNISLTSWAKLHIHLLNVVVRFIFSQFCNFDMSRYGYLEVFQRNPWYSR